MEIKLNIYDETMKEVAKVYTIENFRLKFGTIEDLIKLIDLDKLKEGTDAEIASMALSLVSQGFDSIKDVLKCSFDGLNDEEIKFTDTFEIVGVIVSMIKFAIEKMSGFASGKN